MERAMREKVRVLAQHLNVPLEDYDTIAEVRHVTPRHVKVPLEDYDTIAEVRHVTSRQRAARGLRHHR